MTREEAAEVLKNTEDNINYDKRRDEIYFTHRWVGAYEMAIAALREQPRWISVEERLPEDRDWVLVWHTGYMTPKKAKFEDEGVVVWVLDGHDSLPGDVTHWMPLPQPPEVER